MLLKETILRQFSCEENFDVESQIEEEYLNDNKKQTKYRKYLILSFLVSIILLIVGLVSLLR